jgi:hypothetical protein
MTIAIIAVNAIINKGNENPAGRPRRQPKEKFVVLKASKWK